MMSKRLFLPALFAGAQVYLNKQRYQLPDRPRIKKIRSMSTDERKAYLMRRKNRKRYKIARKQHHRRMKNL